MSGGPAPAADRAPQETGVFAAMTRTAAVVNEWIMRLSTIALLAASGILTLSVVTRYFLKVSTDWQDETSVFLLVGAIFMCSAYVQSYRGHVGIEALATVLSPAANRVRRVFIDVFSLAFCSFFAWKSWGMLHEAWVGKHTTSSTFAPPLWIPYGLLALGMTNLSLQIALQLRGHVRRRKEAA